jgi:mRNA interferase RelE/StbE
LTWAIEFSETARRQLDKLDRPVTNRIFKFLSQRVAPLANPRTIGEALKGERFGELWRYRVGDYRLIAKIEDERLVVLILLVGHRREIYR